MLTVVFGRDGRNRLSFFHASGHAEWAEAGDDIVCAAVSAILQAARLGLEAHANVHLEVRQDKGELHVRWPAGRRDDAAVTAIVRTAELAVERIADQYPAHVTFERRGEA
ncbi:MAG: ribosomal-processing cysteine protease Prp [Candidatus Eremiobacteraeota bacterium]|nr:ribosomal-processing cysteine protease Prp [Candidatus Eremiobacteraeota bacterium]